MLQFSSSCSIVNSNGPGQFRQKGLNCIVFEKLRKQNWTILKIKQPNWIIYYYFCSSLFVI